MILFITGDDYLVSQELRTQKQAFLVANPSSDFIYFDGSVAPITSDAVLEKLQSQGLFSKTNFIVLENALSCKELTEHIGDVLENVDDQTMLVIVEPKPDKRLAVYKNLLKNPNVKHSEQKISDLASWVVNLAKNANSQLTKTDATYLLDRVGENPAALQSELTKLAFYNPKISRATIDLLTNASVKSSVFDLVSAICTQNKKRALALYEEQRFAGNEPHAIIGLLVWQLHMMALASASGGGALGEVAKRAKVSEYALQKSAAIARSIGPESLQTMISRLSKLDYFSKTKSLDLDQAIKNYIVTI